MDKLKKDEELLKKFEELEKNLMSVLKIESIEFNENDSESVVKSKIKKYIKKLSEAKRIFEQYEALAKQIEDKATADQKAGQLAKSVLDLRGTNLTEDSEVFTGETVTATTDEKGNVSVKHEKSNASVREL